MSRYRRTVRVNAPFDEVWAFHRRVSGLEAVTPGFVNLRVERVVGPDGEEDPGPLEVGSRIELVARPFGVGPRQSWTSRIVELEAGAHDAYFVDVMEDGPFPEWRHAHRLRADGDGTVVHDDVHYRLPGGVLGRAAGPFAVVGFEPMFRYRHRRTRALLE
ncbi:SRPBCC family protein [Halorarum salinum]|uniref:SRPBCC family protein n=1 Tax=Halorarum salinum TaxID=2743089 RepID=A0A7D5QH74_9EURY|nr:SRPBCC family protein [Halobaculum salinum]QLG62562.1 SRPBCC family protein [Halobaculum salinum]